MESPDIIKDFLNGFKSPGQTEEEKAKEKLKREYPGLFLRYDTKKDKTTT
jgi:hypothetical protein